MDDVRLVISSGDADVRIPAETTSELRHAIETARTAAANWDVPPDGGSVTIRIDRSRDEVLGVDGYVMASLDSHSILITAATQTGAANGTYGLLLHLSTKQVSAPFSVEWHLTEIPRWADRRVSVATYVMGLTKMTPDVWTFEEWKAYIDFIRSFNMNRLTILGLFPYHPDVPSSYRNRWKLDEQRKAIAYAHEVGIKVNAMTTYNMVPTEVFWEHPELRTEAIPGYYGLTLCWSKAKDLILKHQTYMLEYLEGLDGFEIMVTEPLGWCLCDGCRPDMAAIWIDAVKELGSAMRRINPDAEIVFWNWLSGYFPATKGKYPPTTDIDNVDEIQESLLQGLPADTVFIDLSMNQQRIDPDFAVDPDDPRIIEILDVAPQREFEARNYFFFMDREFGVLDRANMFPKPFLDRIVDEMEYSKQLPVNGVCSYRLAPPARFLCDFYFMRMAWNPELTREDLIDEAASYLTRNPEDRDRIAKALDNIETYWTARDRAALEAARDATLAITDPTSPLSGIRDGLVMLTMVDEYAQTVREHDAAIAECGDVATKAAARQAKLLEIYQAFKRYPVYQGLTTDGVWEPRSILLLLRPRLDLWAAYLERGAYD